MPGYKIISFPQCWNLGLFSYCEIADFLTSALPSSQPVRKSNDSHECVMSNHWVETSRFHVSYGTVRLSVFWSVAWAVLSGTLRPHTKYPFRSTPSTKDFLVTNTRLLQNVPLWLSHVQRSSQVLLLVPWSAGYRCTPWERHSKGHASEEQGDITGKASYA